MTFVIAVLMKDPAEAKTRLAPVLTRPQRERLALRMFENTLSFFSAMLPAVPLLVVTPSERVKQIALSAGALVTLDEPGGDIVTAANCARDWAIAASATTLMIVHADIPVLRLREIDSLLDACEESEVVIAASKDGGTNALILTPPDVIPFCFGPGSARKHEEAGRSAGLTVKTLDAFYLSRDIDLPQDLRLCSRVLSLGRGLPARMPS